MKSWWHVVVMLVLLPMLGEAQTDLLRHSFISPYEAKPVPPRASKKAEC